MLSVIYQLIKKLRVLWKSVGSDESENLFQGTVENLGGDGNLAYGRCRIHTTVQRKRNLQEIASLGKPLRRRVAKEGGREDRGSVVKILGLLDIGTRHVSKKGQTVSKKK